MKSRPPRSSADVPGQLQLDWCIAPPPAAVEPVKDVVAAPDLSPSLVQYLKWDFRTSFPEPTQEALDAGLLSDEDAQWENLKSLHDEHAREALVALQSLDNVLDVRRRGVDPKSGRLPTTKADKLALQEFLQYEQDRFQRWWQTLMDTYEEGFGPEAADAFGKAIRAWHVRVPVIAEAERPASPVETAAVYEKSAVTKEAPTTTESEPTAVVAPKRGTRSQTLRTVARLPVPRPLPEAIAQGRFGFDESQRPIRPSADEVHDITECHAEKIIELLDGLHQVETWLSSSQCSDQARLYHERDALLGRVQSAIAAYAEDFGTRAAGQLDAYARRQSSLQQTPSSTRGRRR